MGESSAIGARNPRVMLIEAWRERLELHAFVRKVMATAEKRSADIILMENKASGASAAQEITRLSTDGEYRVMLIDPVGRQVIQTAPNGPDV